MNARQKATIMRRARAIASANFAEGVEDGGEYADDEGQTLERLQGKSQAAMRDLEVFLDSLIARGA